MFEVLLSIFLAVIGILLFVILFVVVIGLVLYYIDYVPLIVVEAFIWIVIIAIGASAIHQALFS